MSVDWSLEDTPSLPEPGWPLQLCLPTSGMGALPFYFLEHTRHLPLPESLRAVGLLTSCPATEFPACVKDWPSMPSKVRLCIPQMGLSGWSGHHLCVGSEDGRDSDEKGGVNPIFKWGKETWLVIRGLRFQF